MSLTVTVRLFASLRERAGCSSLTRSLAEGATAGDLMAALHEDYPGLRGSGRVAIAVNSEYTDGDHALRDGDEVALIPPVSGGCDLPASRAGRTRRIDRRDAARRAGDEEGRGPRR